MPIRCEFCGESFEDQKALREHHRKKHRDKVNLAKFEHPMKPKTKGEHD